MPAGGRWGVAAAAGLRTPRAEVPPAAENDDVRWYGLLIAATATALASAAGNADTAAGRPTGPADLGATTRAGVNAETAGPTSVCGASASGARADGTALAAAGLAATPDGGGDSAAIVRAPPPAACAGISPTVTGDSTRPSAPASVHVLAEDVDDRERDNPPSRCAGVLPTGAVPMPMAADAMAWPAGKAPPVKPVAGVRTEPAGSPTTPLADMPPMGCWLPAVLAARPAAVTTPKPFEPDTRPLLRLLTPMAPDAAGGAVGRRISGAPPPNVVACADAPEPAAATCSPLVWSDPTGDERATGGKSAAGSAPNDAGGTKVAAEDNAECEGAPAPLLPSSPPASACTGSDVVRNSLPLPPAVLPALPAATAATRGCAPGLLDADTVVGRCGIAGMVVGAPLLLIRAAPVTALSSLLTMDADAETVPRLLE